MRLHYLFDHSVAGTRFLQSSITMFIFKAPHILDLHQLLKKKHMKLDKKLFYFDCRSQEVYHPKSHSQTTSYRTYT